MDKQLQRKYQNLQDLLKLMNKVCIAFSDGVDSALLLKVAADTLGDQNVLAVTAASETYTASEMHTAQQFSSSLGIKHIILKTTEIENPEFVNNTPDRCYYCKKSFYKKLLPLVLEHGFTIICDGNNSDDLSDYRPGRRAAAESGVRSPLLETSFTKADIRNLSRELGLAGFDKPSNPCLASRIPYSIQITMEKLSAIEQSEEFIRSLGYKTVRVRNHGLIASIELPPQEIQQFMDADIRNSVSAKLKQLGFKWISIDIEGYRTGSMNEAL